MFPQANQVSDSRGAQHSYPESSYPQSSFVSSSSSKPSFRPSKSSSSGGVFGSSARNDRTSALKAAFQVCSFLLHVYKTLLTNVTVTAFVGVKSRYCHIHLTEAMSRYCDDIFKSYVMEGAL